MIGDATETRCLVVGAGPAGISAAMWLLDLEVPFDWVDAAGQSGGTLVRVGNPVRHVAGGPWQSGFALAADLQRQIATLGIAPSFGMRVEALDVTQPEPIVDFGRERRVTFRAVILCTGTQPRLLGLPGEAERLGRGVEISVTRNIDRFRGLAVAIVGGGDAALEGALLLAPHCPLIHLIHRGSAFSGQSRFVERVENTPNICLHMGREVASITPAGSADRIEQITLDNEHTLDVDGLFVRVGVMPKLPGGIPSGCFDPHGYLICDANGRSRAPGIWGAGDTISSAHRSVSAAMGDGARAAWDVQRSLMTPR